MNVSSSGSLVVIVVPAARRMRVVLAAAAPVPLFFTVTATEADDPGLPLVGVTVMLEITRSGSDSDTFGIVSSSWTENRSLLTAGCPEWYSQVKSAPGTVPTGLSLANTAAPVRAESLSTKALPLAPAATEHASRSNSASFVSTSRNPCNAFAWSGSVAKLRASPLPRSISPGPPCATISRCPIGSSPCAADTE